ncbi:MAG: hypothetical protein AAF614_11585 [Chloroflexota bacterium]
MNKIETFLETSYPPSSYYAVLRKFLRKKQKSLSTSSVERLYYSLHPVGCGMANRTNPQISTLTKADLEDHIVRLKLKKSVATVETVIGDLRHFFKWCKKRRLCKNIAKTIKPMRRKKRISQRARATEATIKHLLQHLAAQLKHRMSRNIFTALDVALTEQWTVAE